jgi:hypothetical protein
VTKERVRAQQTAEPATPVQAVPVTVTAVTAHNVTVALPGGATVICPRGAGFTYTVNGTGWALICEPAVFAVIPTA